MQVATDIAMLAIFYHGLRLGSLLTQGWMRAIWWFYGLTLIAALAYSYSQKYAKARARDPGHSQL